MFEDHPLFIGPAGSYGRSCANKVVAEADVVFFIGSGTDDQLTRDWTLPGRNTKIIQLDIDPAEIGRNFPGAIGLHCDAKLGLTRLLDYLDSGEPEDVWADRARMILQEWNKSVEPYRNSDAIPIRPERLCKEISGILPKNAILVSDTGYSAIWSGTMIDLNDQAQAYLRAAGSLGWAIPAAIGAKSTQPKKPVICFTGDGGFWYHLSELETASRWGLQIVVIVNNNSVLGQCAPFIHQAYRQDMGDKGDLYEYRDTNFARIANELGCLGIRVEDPREIQDAIQTALGQEIPVVVDIVTDGSAHPVLD
jgi:acetolactate synthase-1/2/3 large subunit